MVSFKDLLNKLRGKEDKSLSPFSLSDAQTDTSSNENIEEGVKVMNIESRASGRVVAQGQITLVDLTDIISQPTAPSPAKENMLWMDTSKTPPVLMVYKGGKWIKENDFKDDPQYNIIKETLTKNTADIEINKEQIALKVTQTEVTNTVVSEVNKTVKSVISEYAKNQNATTAPTTGWSTTPPTWADGWYIWSRTKTTMMSGTSSTSDPVNITGAKGSTGQTGSAGKGIKSTTVTYQASSSGTSVPTGTWSSTVPSVAANQYLWTKTTLTYTDNTTTDAYSVGKMGANGATGSQGPQGPAGSDGKGVKGTAITYQASSSGTTVPTGTWNSSVPSVSAGQFLWTRTVITYTDNSTATAYSVGKMGEQGPQGNQGSTGATGQGVQSITSLYKMLDTKAQQPTPTSDTGWQTTPPTWQKGKYIHTCSKIIYKNPTATAYTVPICDSSWEAANDVQNDLDGKYSTITDKFGKIDASLEKIDISVGEITTANYAKDVENRVNSFLAGAGSNVGAEVKTKVKRSMASITICAEAVGGNSATVTLNKITSTSKTGEVLTAIDLDDVKLYLSKTGKYDEYTTKGIIRRVDPETGGDIAVEGIEEAPALLVLVEEGCTIAITASRNVHSKHTVALNALASIESSVSSINLTKRDIDLKVDKDGVIAAINVGIENDNTSKVLISADKINLEGKVTVKALSKNLEQIFTMGTDKTEINGGYIQSGTIDLSGEVWASGLKIYEKQTNANGEIILDENKKPIRGQESFTVTNTGQVYIKGNIQSNNFSETENTGWAILANGAAIFNQGEFRSKIVLPRAGMTNEGNIRIWAGGDTPATALFRVLDSGDCYIEKGHFTGVFSGDVNVGGISITDEGKNTGRASIRITDNAETLVTEIADDVLTVGTNANFKNMLMINDKVRIGGTDLIFNDKISFKNSDSSISFNNDFANFRVNGTKFDFKVDDSSQTTDFEFSNPKRDTIVEIKGQLKVTSNVDIGVVTIRKQTDGIDFLFI